MDELLTQERREDALESLKGCTVQLRALADFARQGASRYDFAALENVASTMEQAIANIEAA